MVCGRAIHIDLGEPVDPAAELSDIHAKPAQSGTVALHVIFESKFRTRTKAYRHIWFTDSTETVCGRAVECRRYQLVADFRGTRGDVMQTIVAHQRISSTVNSQDGCP